MSVDHTLVVDVLRRCGGGRVHSAMQLTVAYEMAVVRASHPKCKDVAAELVLARQLEQQLRVLSAAM